MKTPTTGWARIHYVTGRRSAWVRPEAMEISDRGVMCEGEIKGEAALLFPWLFIASVEWSTDAEKELCDQKEAEARKEALKKGGES